MERAYRDPHMQSGVVMSARWTLGTPPLRRQASDVVEVTDGNRIERARFRAVDPRVTGPRASGWLREDGAQLEWQPTHWRPAARKHQVVVID